jgi:hypothetical protein
MSPPRRRGPIPGNPAESPRQGRFWRRLDGWPGPQTGRHFHSPAALSQRLPPLMNGLAHFWRPASLDKFLGGQYI